MKPEKDTPFCRNPPVEAIWEGGGGGGGGARGKTKGFIVNNDFP